MQAVSAQPLLDASQIAANAAAIAAHVGMASIHFTEASIDHDNIQNNGVNTHAQLDTHLGLTNVHFLESAIDHDNILNNGTNAHSVIDTHIADAGIHYPEAPNDGNDYVRNSLGWIQANYTSFGEYVGEFDASGGAFPAANNQGDWFNCTVAGTVDGQAFVEGDLLVALIDSPSTTTFAGNWTIIPHIGTGDHTLLTNIGVNTHPQIDTHIADASIHFTQAAISITASQVSNFDTAVAANAAVAANTAKVSNATHTGDVTGATALTAAPAMITGKATVTPVATDLALIVDQTDGLLKSVDVAAFLGGGTVNDLQDAYDGAPTAAPHILTQDAANPIRLQAPVTGPVLQVRDTVGANIFEVDDTFVEVDGQLRIVDSFINHGALNSILLADTFTTGGGFLGGGILSNGTVTYDNSFFIWALMQESKVYQAAAGPGFAAFTLFNALAVIQNSGNFNLVQALILNNGLSHRRTTSGTSTVTQTIGLSNSPNTRSNVSGAIMTKTIGDIAVRHSPTFATVAGSTVNLGTQIGLDLIQPAVALFQTQAGVENMTAYYGVNMGVNPTFGGASAVYSVVRSVMNAGTNKRFLDHTGTAVSRLGGNLFFTADLIGTVYGAAVGGDVLQAWAGGTNSLFWQFTSASGDQLHWSNPGAGRGLMQGGAGGAAMDEFAFNFDRFAFGQSGAVGNQAGVFVANTRTMTIGGGWADFLLTQAGNITVDAAAGQLFGWTINAPSITLGTGSVTDAGGLLLGGNVSQGTNRYGLLVLSNPTGGTLNYCARFQGAAGVLIDGVLEHAGTLFGIRGSTPVTIPTVTGSRGGNAALADLLTDLASQGIIIDGSSA